MVVAPTRHRQLTDPKSSLGTLSPWDAAKLIAAAADVTLILDSKGTIRDAAFSGELIDDAECAHWIGQSWVDSVTSESRAKVEDLLREAAEKAPLRWRHINHIAGPRGGSLPIRYCALQVGQKGRIVALGRDLRAMAQLQQRLYDAQLSLEMEYSRLRLAETRYRLLFEVAAEAVVVVDAATLKVAEANPSAIRLIGRSEKRIIGRSVLDFFNADAGQALQALFGNVRVTGRPGEAVARLNERQSEVAVAATLFRQDTLSNLLIRLIPLQPDPAGHALPKSKSTLLKMIEKLPDGFVVTGPDWRILAANAAFLDMANLASEEQARAETLDNFIGRNDVAFSVLTAHLRDNGLVRNFATTLHGETGAAEDVEITAVATPSDDQSYFGFTIRAARGRLAAAPPPTFGTPRSVEQLTELVGRVSLKDIVRESTDIIEQLAIKAALQLTGDNRASAADMLGMSRQSLYVKLRRHSLGDLDPDQPD